MSKIIGQTANRHSPWAAEIAMHLVASKNDTAQMYVAKRKLEKELKEQKDPRMFGNGDIFEKYIYANPKDRNFYERHINGENPKAGWVNTTDFEKTDN